jgi:hypothetical protein
MAVPAEVSQCQKGKYIQIFTKLCFDPVKINNQHKATLTDEWVSATATRGDQQWTLGFEFEQGPIECIIDDNDEVKSIMSDNLWAAGWFSLHAATVKHKSTFAGVGDFHSQKLDNGMVFNFYSGVKLSDGRMFSKSMVRIPGSSSEVLVFIFAAIPTVDGKENGSED